MAGEPGVFGGSLAPIFPIRAAGFLAVEVVSLPVVGGAGFLFVPVMGRGATPGRGVETTLVDPLFVGVLCLSVYGAFLSGVLERSEATL